MLLCRGNVYIFYRFRKNIRHFFPAVFTLFLFFTLIVNIITPPVAEICNIILAVYILLIFFHALVKNKSLKIALLGIIASFTLLIAYGLGFMQDFCKRVILKIS